LVLNARKNGCRVNQIVTSISSRLSFPASCKPFLEYHETNRDHIFYAFVRRDGQPLTCN
jgi:hypothetical protein